MSNRKRTNQHPTEPINTHNINWFNVVTIIMGIIALYLSWTANQTANRTAEIASQQFKSNIVVLSTMNTGYSMDLTRNESETFLACMERVRLANLGNAKDSIIGYDTVVHYNKTQSTFKANGEAWEEYNILSPTSSFNTFTISDELKPILNSLGVKLAPEYAYAYLSPIDDGSSAGEVASVPFPYPIEGFTSVDLDMGIVYTIPRSAKFSVIDEKGDVIVSSYSGKLSPVEFEVVFKFASGLETNTTLMECGSVGR